MEEDTWISDIAVGGIGGTPSESVYIVDTHIFYSKVQKDNYRDDGW